MNPKKLGKPICLLVASMLSLVLSGCIKARMAIIVEPDGSGTLGMAVGMTQQAMSLAGADGESLMQRLSREMSSQEQSSEDVTVRRWTEGEYEWTEATSSFADLDDLNSRLGDTELFERFSVTRKRGLFKDQFVLDAQLAPLLEDEERPEYLIIDPSGMFEFQVSICLPGDVTQTNGVFASDLSTVLWTVSNYEPLEMHAVSKMWNWFNVMILSAIALGGPLVAVGAGLVFYRATRKNASRPPALATPAWPPASPSLAVSPDILSQINVRGFLEQVNKHTLGNMAVIAEAPNEIWMTWPVVPGSSRKQELRIRVLDRQTLMVNGMRVPATQDGVKQGLVAALRGMGRLS